MNRKHVACALVGILMLALVQSVLWMQQKRTKMRLVASGLKAEEVTASQMLIRERQQLAQLRGSSEGLISFLRTWQPYFEAIDNPQSAEVNFTLKIKEDNLTSIAQRFEQASIKGNPSVPSVMRAFVTFEDDYSRLLNWLGRMENQQPTMRTSAMRLSKGTRANDLRMELTLEQPLLQR